MRWKTMLLIVAMAGLSSCAETREGEQKNTLLSNFIEISDQEDKGVKEVLHFYGGQCKYSIGKGQQKFFELEMSESEIVEDLSEVAGMPASNIAYLFYRNLANEKAKYGEIRTVLKFKSGKEMSFKYSTQELEFVVDRIPTINKLVELLKAQDFESIKPMLNDTSVTQYNKNELVASMEKVDPQFGIPQEFVPYGFRITKSDEGHGYLRISGVVIRDQQNHEFSADFDLDRRAGELLYLDYKL